MTDKRRLIIIDLDGATFDVIRPLAEAGRLPNLKRLMDEGVHGAMNSTIPAITPCAYSSFITGKRPSGTGIFDFVFKRPGDAGISTVNSNVLDGVPFWKVMNSRGRRVGIVNLPMTYPASPVDGFMVGCGLTAPGPGAEGFCHPEDIFERNGLDRDSYILKPEWRTMRYGTGDDYRRVVLEMFETRKKATLRLMENEAWDFFMVHVHAIDWLQHNFWGDDEVITDVHEKVDRFIGRVLETVDEETAVMIMSDHGFGPTHRTLSLSKWLIREGFLKTRPLSFGEFYEKALRKLTGGEGAGYKVLAAPYSIMPGGVKALFDRVFTRLYDSLPALRAVYDTDYMGRIDWDRTLAYTYGQIGAVYLNASAGDDEEVRKDLAARLMTITDENGEKLVEKVYTREELFEGAHSDTAPDLLVHANRVMYFHPDLDMKGIITPPAPWRVGNHARQGVFIARGGDFARGKDIGEIDITELSPTVLHAMGLPVLKEMDGRPRTDCFTDAYAAANPVKMMGSGEFGAEKTAGREEDDADHIKEQLKGLGYI